MTLSDDEVQVLLMGMRDPVTLPTAKAIPEMDHSYSLLGKSNRLDNFKGCCAFVGRQCSIPNKPFSVVGEPGLKIYK